MTQKLTEARSATAAEWASLVSESDARSVDRFYRDSVHLASELAAWHATPERLGRTEAIVNLAKQIRATSVVDIGAGGGQDLQALRSAGIPGLVAVEPNRQMLGELEREGFEAFANVAAAPVEYADLILLVDVLEHVPEPETFLAEIARRARVGGKQAGAVIVEVTATYDVGTPLHLRSLRGWHPGRVLEHHGFQQIGAIGGMRFWQRANAQRVGSATALLLCAYRALSIPTFTAVQLLANRPNGWRVITKTGDGLISRARSVVASRWLLETDDDVFLMIDDDITFLPEVAEAVVAKVHGGLDIVAAAYPVRSGRHLAIYGLDGTPESIGFGSDEPPLEIRWAGTGFFAVHRRVLEVLARTLTYVHEDQAWGFWPFFMPMLAETPSSTVYLSEDWAFCERARAAGFHVWLDPSARIGHLATLELNVANMDAVARAVGSGFEGGDM